MRNKRKWKEERRQKPTKKETWEEDKGGWKEKNKQQLICVGE